jgi:hypothetical protein
VHVIIKWPCVENSTQKWFTERRDHLLLLVHEVWALYFGRRQAVLTDSSISFCQPVWIEFQNWLRPFFSHIPSNSYLADRPTIRRFIVRAIGSVCKRLNVSLFPLSQQMQLFHGYCFSSQNNPGSFVKYLQRKQIIVCWFYFSFIYLTLPGEGLDTLSGQSLSSFIFVFQHLSYCVFFLFVLS